MSRIGRMPITVPADVTVTVAENNVVTVKGKLGTLTQQFSTRMTIAQEGNQIIVTRPTDEKEDRSVHGLTRTLINNMVVGVSAGYQKKLEIVGVGYRVAKQGNKLVLNLGHSHAIEVLEENGVTFEVPNPNAINDLCRDVCIRAIYCQTRASLCTGDLCSNSLMSLKTREISVFS